MDEKRLETGKIVRSVVILALVALFIGLIIFNVNGKGSLAGKVWDERATLGSTEAKNYYVMYTDLACPYCDVFSRALLENEEEFRQDYVEGKDILYEVRVTDFLYEYGEHKPDMSRWSAKGVYCATAQDKFWDYYHAALQALYEDYHSKGIGVSKDSPEIKGMEETYWTEKVAKRAGVDNDEFQSCYASSDTLKAVEKNTQKTAQAIQGGLPYFAFNKYTTSGFDNSWGWEYVKRYLDAGLEKA